MSRARFQGVGSRCRARGRTSGYIATAVWLDEVSDDPRRPLGGRLVVDFIQRCIVSTTYNITLCSDSRPPRLPVRPTLGSGKQT